MASRNRYRIWPVGKDEVYERAKEWLATFDPEIASLEGAYGISYINGKIYISEVGFAYEDDYLIFKLKFPELFTGGYTSIPVTV